MRMHKMFTRRKGAGPGVVLGTDGAAGTPPTVGAPTKDMDTVLIASHCNSSGFPVDRIVVAYNGPPGAIAITAALWTWDDLTQAWYECAAPTTLTPNRITYFDLPVLQERSPLDGGGGTSGSIGVKLVILDSPGVNPDGLYNFAIGADL